jgi:hypothetical protein
MIITEGWLEHVEGFDQPCACSYCTGKSNIDFEPTLEDILSEGFAEGDADILSKI